jgi:hypothetical protein
VTVTSGTGGQKRLSVTDPAGGRAWHTRTMSKQSARPRRAVRLAKHIGVLAFAALSLTSCAAVRDAPQQDLGVAEKAVLPPIPDVPMKPDSPAAATKRELACLDEARKAGADPTSTPAAFRYYVAECLRR